MKRAYLARWLIALLALPVIASGASPAAFAQTGSPPQTESSDELGPEDNVAYAENTEDGSSIFAFAFEVKQVMDSTVDVDNAAIAFSSCTSCRTVAVAISIVLIMSDPDIVTTENVAIAVNYQCNLCRTMALAYQLVLTTGGPMELDEDFFKESGLLIRRIQNLAASEMPLAEIDAKISALVDELFTLVRKAVAKAAKDHEDRERERTEDEPDDGGATPSISPSGTTTPSASPSEAYPASETPASGSSETPSPEPSPSG